MNVVRRLLAAQELSEYYPLDTEQKPSHMPVHIAQKPV